ncbi:MAG TPA: endolytic transglycosylase MltG, partial [Allosphingosinicella sp.]|nr:endolytic transglycosylase MltG [Allosphingosinicella sp.]
MKRALLLLGLPAGLILAAGVAFWLLWVGPGPASQPVTIIVEQGSSVARVAQQLEEAGVIRGNATTFRGFARLFGAHAPVQAGEFRLREGMSPAAILNHLQYGRPVQRLVTIPEGMPSVLVHERLMRVPYLTGTIEVPAEGSVLPDSYGYRRGESRAALLGRMRAAMRAELARLWEGRSPGTVVVSPAAAVILASIVEKETGKPSERRLIAGVYSNRLR